MIKITEFYSPTCVPCKMLRARLEDIANNTSGVELEFINALNDDRAIGKGIKSCPHIIVTENEKELINEHGSFQTLDKIKEILKNSFTE